MSSGGTIGGNVTHTGNIQTATSTDYAVLHGIEGGLRVLSSRSGDAGILLTNNSGAFRAQLYGDGTNYGFLTGHWAAWDIKKVVDGNLIIRKSGSDYTVYDTQNLISYHAISPFLQYQTISDYNTGSDTRGFTVAYASGSASNKPTGTDHATLTMAYSSDWQVQMAGDWRTNEWYVRNQNSNSWGTWQRLHHTGNLGSWQDSDRNFHLTAPTNTNGQGLLGKRNDGTFQYQIYGDGSNAGFLNGAFAAWDLKKVLNGNLVLRVSGTDRNTIHSGGGTMNATLSWNTLSFPHITTTGSHGLWISSNGGDVYLYDGSKNHYFYVYSGTTAKVLLSSTSTSYFTGGNVAIGGTGGYQKLSVEGGNIYMSTGNQITWSNGNATIGESSYNLQFSTYSGSAVIERMRIESDGDVHCDADVIAFSSTIGSDRRLKKNIVDIKYGLNDVLKLRGVEFDWNRKNYDKKHDVGFIAQEVQKVIPELVKRVSGLNNKDSFLTVDYAKLVPVLVESIKELKQEIKDLKNVNN
tara:strand:- start:1688 stop:3250 length:1563 start_codon:yes stop_codon:yes gene_type:complete